MDGEQTKVVQDWSRRAKEKTIEMQRDCTSHTNNVTTFLFVWYPFYISPFPRQYYYFSMFKSTKPLPPPQNFRANRPDELVELPKKDIGPLPPNVFVAPDAPADKPGPNWLRMVCVSDTHNTTDANNYPVPEADILGKRLSKALRYRPWQQRIVNLKFNTNTDILVRSACRRLYKDGHNRSDRPVYLLAEIPHSHPYQDCRCWKP